MWVSRHANGVLSVSRTAPCQLCSASEWALTIARTEQPLRQRAGKRVLHVRRGPAPEASRRLQGKSSPAPAIGPTCRAGTTPRRRSIRRSRRGPPRRRSGSCATCPSAGLWCAIRVVGAPPLRVLLVWGCVEGFSHGVLL